ncbi:hypothetical protein D1816_14825 [Aquimarina sp. AD10]|uniref:Uncharacterized protein n=1 Tax=Aquimarina aggregata TaxID=1642818 RepID=A0A162WJ82_9FLAO|nr:MULTISPECIES: class I lanthipeptide [Aquimarina]AXT61569.1 hypothetical protein D1816_14825 [Aquimarina sp. AD10]KZS38136.1 hypothetical protein AWE51_19010 [Aquimarina aggregata]RKM90053.1 hypothetical protein D7033_25345 [Aquimarina sp. AD10]
MKTHKSNALRLQKLTVARINPEALQRLKGGTSVAPSVNGNCGGSHRPGVNGFACHQIVR